MVSEEKSHNIDHIQAADITAGWAVDLLIFRLRRATLAAQEWTTCPGAIC